MNVYTIYGLMGQKKQQVTGFLLAVKIAESKSCSLDPIVGDGFS